MLVQALLVLGSMLTALAIGVDASLYLMQRYQLQHALLDTVRLHTRTHMQPSAFASDLKTQLKRMHLPLVLGWPHSWHAEQHSPNDKDFQHFRDPHLEKQLQWPHLAINNDYQDQQHQQNPASTLFSGRNIFTANTLQLHFYYAYQPYNPVVRALLKGFESWAQHSYTRQLLNQGMLPIKVHISHPYASHPIAWPFQAGLPYHRSKQATHADNPQASMGTHTHLLPPQRDSPPVWNDNEKPHRPPKKDDDSVGFKDYLDGQPSDRNTGTDPAGQKSDGSNPGQSAAADDALNCDHPACCGDLIVQQ